MTIKDIGKLIYFKHNYSITARYWSRLAKLCDRYGAEAVFKAIEDAPEDSNNLTHLLNYAEVKCQNMSLTDLNSIVDEIFE